MEDAQSVFPELLRPGALLRHCLRLLSSLFLISSLRLTLKLPLRITPYKLILLICRGRREKLTAISVERRLLRFVREGALYTVTGFS